MDCSLESRTRQEVYFHRLQGPFARQIYEESKKLVRLIGVDSFALSPSSSNYRFDEQTQEIVGSNFFSSFYVDLAIRQEGLWIPAYYEAKELEKLPDFPKDVSRIHGLIIFKEDKYGFVEDAKKLSLEMPPILPFKAIDYKERFALNGNKKGIISGQPAVQISYLNNFFRLSNNSTRLVLIKDESGKWYGDKDFRFDCDSSIDYVCSYKESLNGVKAVNLDSPFLEDEFYFNSNNDPRFEIIVEDGNQQDLIKKRLQSIIEQSKSNPEIAQELLVLKKMLSRS